MQLQGSVVQLQGSVVQLQGRVRQNYMGALLLMSALPGILHWCATTRQCCATTRQCCATTRQCCATTRARCLSLIPDDGSCVVPKRWTDSSHLDSVCKLLDM